MLSLTCMVNEWGHSVFLTFKQVAECGEFCFSRAFDRCEDWLMGRTYPHSVYTKEFTDSVFKAYARLQNR